MTDWIYPGVGEGKTVKVISAQVRSIRLELDDVNYYRAYQYVVDVDQQLFVNGTAVDDAEIYPSDTYGPNVCWGNYMCNCLHPSSHRLSGKNGRSFASLSMYNKLFVHFLIREIFYKLITRQEKSDEVIPGTWDRPVVAK